MKTHYFIGNWELALGELEITDRPTVHQIANVLKLTPGEKIILGDGEAGAFDAEILAVSKKSVQVNCLSPATGVSEPERETVLYCAMLKKENFELVCQKATEAGVKIIVPLITARTVKTALNFDRLDKIVKEAAEQSGRLFVPEILKPMAFADALAELRSGDSNFFCHFGGENIGTLTFPQNVGIFVGPEGGWTEDEANLAKDRGLKTVSLGQTALRAETAAMVAAWAAVNALDR